MKKEIILEEPYMKSVPYLASFFSFLEVNQITMPWLLKFFSSPFAMRKILSDEFEMKSHGIVSANYLNDYFMMCCPFVEVCNINQNLVDDDIFKVIKRAILNGFCMTAVINPHYIKAYGEFEVSEHDLLITGFDDENRLVYGKDFFPPKSKFEKREISFQEYADAFAKRNSKYNIRFFKKRKVVSEPAQEDLRKTLCETLKNFLNEHLPVENPYYPLAVHPHKEEFSEFKKPAEVWTGIGIYDGLIQNIDNIYFRNWVLFIDVHRLIYDSLVCVLPSSGDLNEFSNIIRDLEIVLSLAIKYDITEQRKLLSNMVNKLAELKERERECITILLYKLST